MRESCVAEKKEYGKTICSAYKTRPSNISLRRLFLLLRFFSSLLRDYCPRSMHTNFLSLNVLQFAMSSFAVCFNFHSLFPNQPTIHWPLQCNLFRIFFFSFPGMHALCNVAHCIRDRLRIAPALNFYICFFNWSWYDAKRCHIETTRLQLFIYFCSIFCSSFTCFIRFYFRHIR